MSVELLEEDAARVLVRGQKPRTVTLRPAGATLFASCSCAQGAVPLAPCRHVWAALLELGRREAFPAQRATRGALTVLPDTTASACAPTSEAHDRAAEKPEKAKSRMAGAGKAKAGDTKATKATPKTRARAAKARRG